MRSIRAILPMFCFAVLLTSCIKVSRRKFSFNFVTGEIQQVYRDLSSNLSPRKDSNAKDCDDATECSPAKDWAGLKEMVAEKKPEFDSDVVEDISKVLFEENKVLCGRKIQKVKCPKCFPSKAAILSYLHDKDWRFDLVNDEVVLFLPPEKKIISTNGQSVTTSSNSVIIWPQDTTKFEYEVSEDSTGVTSLLPYYLKEKNGK